MSLPEPPQCVSASFRRWAALPLMKTVPLPAAAVQMFGPQQAVCIPVSSTRSAGFELTFTVGEPQTAGPTAGCGQAGQPCASALS